MKGGYSILDKKDHPYFLHNSQQNFAVVKFFSKTWSLTSHKLKGLVGFTLRFINSIHMRKLQKILLYLSILCLACSCSTQQSLYITRGPCFGNCSEYTVEIVYRNLKFTPQGNSRKLLKPKSIQINKREADTLREAIERVNFGELLPVYDGSVYDVSKTTIQFGQYQVEFKFRQSVPNELQSLINQLDQLLQQYELIKEASF